MIRLKIKFNKRFINILTSKRKLNNNIEKIHKKILKRMQKYMSNHLPIFAYEEGLMYLVGNSIIVKYTIGTFKEQLIVNHLNNKELKYLMENKINFDGMNPHDFLNKYRYSVFFKK
jgi:hypothetical protein